MATRSSCNLHPRVKPARPRALGTLLALALILSFSGCRDPERESGGNVPPPGGKADDPHQPPYQVESELSGDRGRLTVSFEFPEATVDAAGDAVRVAVAGVAPFRGHPGSPILPRRTWRLLIPAGHEVKRVAVEPEATFAIAIDKPVEHHVGFTAPCDQCPARPPASPDPAIYGTSDLFPAVPVALRSLQQLHGYAVAVVDFYPVQVRPAAGRLLQTARGKLVVETQLRLEPFSWTGRAIGPTAHDLQGLASIADDTSFVPTYEVPYHSPTAEPAEYLIITVERFAHDSGPWSLSQLLGHKRQRGLSADLVTREWIEAHLAGRDVPEKIRNYIIEAYRERGTRYVLLAGDSDARTTCRECEPALVPHRSLVAEAGGKRDQLPADCYYSNLDGSFDGNANGVFGEPDDGEHGGEVDLLPEVAVGRAPVDSELEVANFVRKTITYERQAAPPLVLLAGELLWSPSTYRRRVHGGALERQHARPAQDARARRAPRNGQGDPVRA